MLKEADINSNDPDVLANMVFVRPEWKRVYELKNGLYTMHPALQLEPAILAAYLLGIPFLLRRLRRSIAAQILLGTMLFTTIVCYVPWISTFVGNPHRPTLTVVAYCVADPTCRPTNPRLDGLGDGPPRRVNLNRIRVSRTVSQFLPLAMLAALMLLAEPSAVAGAKQVYNTNKVLQSWGYCLDPIYPWMQDNIKKTSVVLAPGSTNTCLPVYSANANVVSLRGTEVLNVLPALEKRAPGKIQVPQGARDVQKFFYGTTLEKRIGILKRDKVDYVMAFKDFPLNEKLKQLSGLVPMDTPGQRYNLYSVDLSKLGE